MRIGHYAVKAREEIATYVADITRDFGPLENIQKPQAKEALKSLAYIDDLLEDSVCWSLNEDAFPMVWHTDLDSSALEGARLPYNDMVIEYDFDYEALGLPNPATGWNQSGRPVLEARKRIICLNTFENEGVEGFCLTPMFFVEGGQWAASAAAAFVPFHLLGNLEAWFRTQIEGSNDFVIDWGENGITHFPSMPIYSNTFNSPEYDRAVEELGDELRVVLGFLQILQCDNAPVDEVPPQAALNKKRAKRGKPKIPTYRTLRVSSHTKRGKRSGAAATGGTKRTHWRRGHIRNQPTAKGYIKKWIKPTIIGAGKAPKPEIVMT